jgi:hypothetical protein
MGFKDLKLDPASSLLLGFLQPHFPQSVDLSVVIGYLIGCSRF